VPPREDVMAAQVPVRSVEWWDSVTMYVLVLCLAQNPLFAQRGTVRYVGGTLGTALNVVQFGCKSSRGTLDITSDSNLVFGGDVTGPLTIGYDSISSLTYGPDSVKGAFCYPWDSAGQFSNKRHYVLTVLFQDSTGSEQAVAFELEKAAVRPTLARLEARSRKRVEYTSAVACLQYQTPDECHLGQVSELKGLTKVFIDTRSPSDHDVIASEITASQLGLTVLGDQQGAEITLRYTGALVGDAQVGAFGASGGKVMNAGRGEVSVIRDGRPRVVIMFEDRKTSHWEKEPATNFGKTFVEAYRTTVAAESR